MDDLRIAIRDFFDFVLSFPIQKGSLTAELTEKALRAAELDFAGLQSSLSSFSSIELL